MWAVKDVDESNAENFNKSESNIINEIDNVDIEIVESLLIFALFCHWPVQG